MSACLCPRLIYFPGSRRTMADHCRIGRSPWTAHLECLSVQVAYWQFQGVSRRTRSNHRVSGAMKSRPDWAVCIHAGVDLSLESRGVPNTDTAGLEAFHFCIKAGTRRYILIIRTPNIAALSNARHCIITKPIRLERAYRRSRPERSS